MIDVYVSLALAARPPVKPTSNCHINPFASSRFLRRRFRYASSDFAMDSPTPYAFLVLPDGIVSLLPDNVISFPWQERYNFMLISRLENRTAVRKMDSWNLIFFFLYFFASLALSLLPLTIETYFHELWAFWKKRKEGRNCGVVRWWVQWRVDCSKKINKKTHTKSRSLRIRTDDRH